MSPSGYTVEITNLPSDATKDDAYDFVAFCCAIQSVEIVRCWSAGQCNKVLQPELRVL
ncbi:hypothetical protein CASFOL_027406 [Castilleja foliolosa]|uniref:RRM domain-containing protein n=1 Tax=Castilleja foliolosa TaxID=1961234 RepID=A0ABD3CHW5_9LAMI